MSEFLDDEKLQSPQKPTTKTWLKRFGVAGFLFFLIKGLVWLVILFGLGKGCESFF